MQPGRYFVTGIDTDAGKTWVTCHLLRAATARGWSSLGLKPVAAGQDGSAGRNRDAQALQAASSVPRPYEEINPLLLPEPLSPHLAARRAGVRVSVPELAATVTRVAEQSAAQLVLAEGAGGWLAPLTEQATMADLARALGWPVLLVVRMRLGCLNHALLTARAIQADGLVLAGWIANLHPDDRMTALDDNLTTLQARLPAPRWTF